MKKIIAAFDGTKYSEGASKYAIELAKATNSLLVGIFIQDMRYLNFTYAYAWDQPFIDFTTIEATQQEEKEKVELNISLFKHACEARGVHHKVHLDKGVPLQEILKESVFADVIVIDENTGFFTMGESAPSPFLKDLLVDSHCPVLIVPHHYEFFDKVVLCYDGSPSSVYAIKQFAYLFPELEDLKTTVVSVNESSTNHLKDGRNFKDLIHAHYKETDYEVMHGDPGDQIINYLRNCGGHAIVIMGSYGRNAVSRLFQSSLSNRVIKELNLPVFITHQ
jgi:nucleotide-binding universal stress UspA family protein